jgi:hypothetical protein
VNVLATPIADFGLMISDFESAICNLTSEMASPSQTFQLLRHPPLIGFPQLP